MSADTHSMLFQRIHEGISSPFKETQMEAHARLEDLEEQLEVLQRESHEWNAMYGRLSALLIEADEQLSLENEKHPNHNITVLRRKIADHARRGDARVS